MLKNSPKFVNFLKGDEAQNKVETLMNFRNIVVS